MTRHGDQGFFVNLKKIKKSPKNTGQSEKLQAPFLYLAVNVEGGLG